MLIILHNSICESVANIYFSDIFAGFPCCLVTLILLKLEVDSDIQHS